jgi:hypothetical protein
MQHTRNSFRAIVNTSARRTDNPGGVGIVGAAESRPSSREMWGSVMQSNSRTLVSVVGMVFLVVMTVLLAAWSPPQSTPSSQGTAVAVPAR